MLGEHKWLISTSQRVPKPAYSSAHALCYEVSLKLSTLCNKRNASMKHDT